MFVKRRHGYTALALRAHETTAWAKRPEETWPCSTLSGHHVSFMFDRNGDLIDSSLPDNADGNEVDAIIEDAIGTAHPTETSPLTLGVHDAPWMNKGAH